MTDSTVPRGADLVGVIVGLEEYAVLDAVDDGALTVEVTPARGEAPCPGCGVFSSRVKSRRFSAVRDCPAFGRPARLRVIKPPPRRDGINGRCVFPPRPAGRRPGRDHHGGSHVHSEPFDGVGAQLCPCSLATATPRPSPWPPDRRIQPIQEFPAATLAP